MYIFRLQSFFYGCCQHYMFCKALKKTKEQKTNTRSQILERYENNALMDSQSSLYKQHKMTHNNTSIYRKKKEKIIHITQSPSVLECLFVQPLRSSNHWKTKRDSDENCLCPGRGVCLCQLNWKKKRNGPKKKTCALHSHSTGEPCPPISRLRATSQLNVEDF